MSRVLVPSPADETWMAEALALGRTHLGLVAPNPSVGALVVRNGEVVGRGVTAPGGRPHAETVALADAGENARGATLYVTLEPCSHIGHTGPCADAAIAAGVARVVSAMEDPDPRVAGRGHARLRAAGVEVLVGVLAAVARRDNLGHALKVTHHRPTITLKLAQTRDGFVAGDEHDPRLMITGADAHARTHLERAQHDAVMVGVGTVLADDPMMNVRLAGFENRRPKRIVLDTHLRTPLASRLVMTAGDFPVWIVTGAQAEASKIKALQGRGVEIVPVATGAGGHVDVSAALHELAARGLTRVFCEGGPQVASALILRGFADRCLMFSSPKPLGRPGVAALSDAARIELADTTVYALEFEGACGQDHLQIYDRKF